MCMWEYIIHKEMLLKYAQQTNCWYAQQTNCCIEILADHAVRHSLKREQILKAFYFSPG